MNNYILQYYQAIEDGTEIVGQWVRLAYKMIVDGLEKKEFFYDAKKAKAVIFFFENFVHHTKGRSDLIKLELWQKAGLSVAFGIVDENGKRQFREFLWLMGRKQGKSLLAYGTGEYMFLFDNEYGAEIYCLAPKLDQTEIVYGGLKKSLECEPELQAMVTSRKTDLYVKSTNSIFKKIAFSEKKSDGFNPHCAICDELAAWAGEAGKKQYEVITSALGARSQPMVAGFTTANYVKNGIFDDLFKRSTRVLLGDTKEKRLFPLLYMIDDVDKWNDLNELKKAMPNLGVSVSIDFILNEINIAESSLSKKAEFMTKYCCIPQNSSAAWLSTNTINDAVCEPIKPEDFYNCYAVGGLDLSMTTDLTSACVVIEKGGIEYVISHFWLPSEKIDEAISRDSIPYREMIQKGILSLSGEGFVDYNDVFMWFVRLVQDYKIMPLVVGYDRYSSQYLVQQMKNEGGFFMDDCWQGWNMTPAINKLEGELKERRIKIGDNELLRIHLLDTAIQKDKDSRRVKIIKLNASSHIDGTAALLDALIVKDKWAGDYSRQLMNE